jgi:prolactin regulatory element-binding protein
VILDQVDTHKPIIKDLDFSLNVAILASTSNDSGCRIWDLAKGTYVTSLPLVKGESYGFATFSKDGTNLLLYNDN